MNFTTYSPLILAAAHFQRACLPGKSHTKCSFLAFYMQYNADLQGCGNNRARLDCALSPSEFWNFEQKTKLASIKKQQHRPGACLAPASSSLGHCMGNYLLQFTHSFTQSVSAVQDNSIISKTKIQELELLIALSVQDIVPLASEGVCAEWAETRLVWRSVSRFNPEQCDQIN